MSISEFSSKFISFVFNKYLLSLLILIGFFINFFLIYIILILILLKLYLENKKIFFLILSYVLFTLLLFDFWNLKKPKLTKYNIASNVEYSIHPEIGYQPKKNRYFKEEIYLKNNKINEIKYTINEFGHRITGDENKESKKCIFVHGGSFAFGQMLNDEQSLPFLINLKLKNNFRVYNFAFNGYGPHQFLRKLEVRYLEDYSDCSDTIVLYEMIPDHIGRVAGKRSWGDKSPRYFIKGNNLMHGGFFSKYPYKILMKIRKNFRNSKFISTFIYNPEKITNYDNQVFLKVLKQIEVESKINFHKVNFLYVAWNLDLIKNSEIIEFIKSRNNIDINQIDFKGNKTTNEYDGHPSFLANDIISDEVIKKINLAE